MKIAVASDHIAFNLKQIVVQFLETQGHEVIDCGPENLDRTHYPIYGHKCGTLVAQKVVDKGVVMCGTAIGISNAANKTKGVRCALVNNIEAAEHAAKHLNANIIAFGSKVTGDGLALKIVEGFLKTKYLATAENKSIITAVDNIIKHDNYDPDIFQTEIKRWEQGYYHD